MGVYKRLDFFLNLLEKSAFLASKLGDGPLLEHGPLIEFYGICNNRVDWFMSYLVRNPKDRFSRINAYIILEPEADLQAITHVSVIIIFYMDLSMRKPIFKDLQPGHTQSSLLSYRD